MNKRIILFNTYGYSGGPLVISQLCKSLRELGYDARLFMSPFIPWGYEVPKMFLKSWIHFYLMRLKRIFLHPSEKMTEVYAPGVDVNSVGLSGLAFEWNPFFSRKDTIVLYPEIVYGNPLQAENVVRWLLFHPVEKTKASYASSDICVAYRDFFNDMELNPKGYKCTIATFDSTLYRQYNHGERHGNCYIIRKGKDRVDLPKSFDGPILDDSMPQREWVRVLNECKFCYSYDTQTFYTMIAAVCGCIPIVVMEPGKTEKDYLGPGEKHLGRAYGDTAEQIQYAIDTRGEMLRLLDFSERNGANAQGLVNLLETKFGKIRRIR